RQHAQLELESPLLARPPGRLLARRAIGAALEMEVAEAAVAALDEKNLFVRDEQLGDDLPRVRVGEDRAHRHAQHDVVGGRAVLVGAAAVLAIARFMAARVAEIDQRVEVAIAHRVDAAAAPAVAAVGAAEGYELFATKAHAAVAAVAGDDVDGGLVDELHACGLSVVDGGLSPGLWLMSDHTPSAMRITGHQS